MAVVDIDTVDTVVNHRSMSSDGPVPNRPRRKSFAPSASCSGIVRAGSIFWDLDRDTGTMVWSGVMGNCRCGASQGSHQDGEEGCQMHGE